MSNGQLKVPSENTFGPTAPTSRQEEIALVDKNQAVVSIDSQVGVTGLSASSISKQIEEKESETTEEVPIKIGITLPTNAYFVSGIRDFCMTLARNISGFSKQWAYRFQSVVDELINNAIEFGSKPGDNIIITFISVEHKYIEVLVEDNGTGQNGMNASQINAFVKKRENMDSANITSIRGRGLSQIVSKWADSLDFKQNEKGGITAHVIKHFQEDEEMVIPL